MLIQFDTNPFVLFSLRPILPAGCHSSKLQNKFINVNEIGPNPPRILKSLKWWNDEIMIEGSNLQIFNFPGFKIFVNFDKIKFCRNSVSGFRLTVYSDDSCVMILKDWSNPVQCKESRAGFILITLWYTQKSNTLLTFTKYKIN